MSFSVPAHTTQLTLDSIHFSNEGSEPTVCFKHQHYYPHNTRSVAYPSVPLQAALRIFRAVQAEDLAVALEGRARDLTLNAEKFMQQLEDARKASVSKIKELEQDMIGSELGYFTISVTGEKYHRDPLDLILCRLNAQDRGEKYKKPSLDEFLKTAALSLCRFQEPYRREDFLATPHDLQQIGNDAMQNIQEVTEDLERYILNHTDQRPVSLELTNREALEKVLENLPGSGSDKYFFKLQIGQEMRYLQYQPGPNPFKFLT